MVINATRIFRCTHTFVSVIEGKLLLFACASCGYRTELLPLERRPRRTKPLKRRKVSGERRQPTLPLAIGGLRAAWPDRR